MPVPPVVPDYDGDVLGRVLPAAAASIGASVFGAPGWALPEASRVCVVLVDGLGYVNLSDPSARAPFLKGLLGDGRVLRAGFPTTTAASMGSFGTSRPPGRHGLVGYEVLDPDRDVLVNGLHWDPAVDPQRWQRYPTVFEQLDQQGLRSARVGPERFDGSGLTQAALRGGSFVGATKLSEVCDAGARLIETGTQLVYLYWGGVDYAGHTHGWRTRQWRDALAELDRAMQALHRRLPAGTLLVVTADHGMVDLDHSRRHDLAGTPHLLAGVRHLGGETRCLQLYTEPGAATRVAAGFAEAFGDLVWVRTRDEAIADGWFGPVDPHVAPRIGDVIVAAAGDFGLVDSDRADPKVLRLRGQHGSLTDAEQLIPLLSALR